MKLQIALGLVLCGCLGKASPSNPAGSTQNENAALPADKVNPSSSVEEVESPAQKSQDESTDARDVSAPAPNLRCNRFPEMLSSTTPATWTEANESDSDCKFDRRGKLVTGSEQEEQVTVEVGGRAKDAFTVTSIGPSGSGRFWMIGVNFAKQHGAPGFCTSTETLAWREVGANPTLSAKLAPLMKSVQDVDGDGESELVIPQSLDGNDDKSGLIVAVYRTKGTHFTFDVENTRSLNRKLAEAYAEAAREAPSSKYQQAANLVEKFCE